MTEFQIYGPLSIPYDKNVKERTLLIDKFWFKHKNFFYNIGCYIYALTMTKTCSSGSKYSKKIEIKQNHIPYYIGSTTKCFGYECFSNINLKYFNDLLRQYSRYNPSIFFILPNEYENKSISTEIDEIRIEIDELKNFLFQSGRIVNYTFYDLNSNKLPDWSLKGLINNTKRKVKNNIEIKTFKKMMGLNVT